MMMVVEWANDGGSNNVVFVEVADDDSDADDDEV